MISSACANLHALTLLDHAHEVRCVDEAVHRAGVQPREAAAQQLNVERLFLQIHGVERGDFQLAARTRLHLMRHGGDALRIEVQTRHSVIALGLLRLFLNGNDTAALIELHPRRTVQPL